MLFPCAVQDSLNLSVLGLCPLFVGWSTVLSNSIEYGKKRNSDDGFLIQDIDLIADSRDAETRTSRQKRDL